MKRRLFLASGLISGLAGSRHAFSQDDSDVLIQELLGKKRPPLFDGTNYNMRKPAADAFAAMQADAAKEGIGIYSLSSYRSFDRQLGIWNRKYGRYIQRMDSEADVVREILRFSSIPGTSRHHWGTDVDIIDDKRARPGDPLNERHYKDGEVYGPLYEWLCENAESYGFYESYTDDPERKGYEYEPWHWSFAELSVPYLKLWKSLDLHKEIAKPPLKGHGQLTPAFFERFKAEWGLGINPALLP